MLEIVILIIVFYFTLISLIIFIRKLVIKRAINYFIKPKLEAKGLVFINYKWLGYFDRGDFKKDNFVIIPSLKFGYPITSTYIDVLYSNAIGNMKITVRIDQSLVWIRNIFYSREP